MDENTAADNLEKAVFNQDGTAPQPTAPLNFDINVQATVTEESEATLQQMVRDIDRVQKTVERMRENAFRDGDSVYGVTVEDAVERVTTSELRDKLLVLGPNREDIAEGSAGRWTDIFEHGISLLQDDPDLDRSDILNHYDGSEYSSPSPPQLAFSVDSVITVETSDKHLLKIAIEDSDREITFRLQDPLPDGWQDATVITVRKTRELRAVSSEMVSMSDAGFTLNFDVPTLRSYVDTPTEEVGSINSEDSQLIQQCLEEGLTPDTLSALLNLVERNFSEEQMQAFLLFISGDWDAILLDYQQHPPVVVGIARIWNADLTPIPQSGDVILLRPNTEVPIDVAQDFPEKQHLINDKWATIRSITGYPDYACEVSGATGVERCRTTEILFDMVADNQINPQQVKAYHTVPWTPLPNPDLIYRTISQGNLIKNSLSAFDSVDTAATK